jgi:hypothetical protein
VREEQIQRHGPKDTDKICALGGTTTEEPTLSFDGVDFREPGLLPSLRACETFKRKSCIDTFKSQPPKKANKNGATHRVRRLLLLVGRAPHLKREHDASFRWACSFKDKTTPTTTSNTFSAGL